VKLADLPPCPRIGLFGGTFDPPHSGHISSAVAVRRELRLHTVLLVVANVPWQKKDTRVVTPAEDRCAMVAAAVEGIDGLELCRLEIDRGGLSYTADTVEELLSKLPDAQLFTILGWDAAVGLFTWERVDEVITRSTLVVIDRPGSTDPLPEGPDWLRVAAPLLDVSSSDVRYRLSTGRPVDGLIPAGVLAQVRARRLYGTI
jgi:nicotinate-nucleotide adenylyltransferase